MIIFTSCSVEEKTDVRETEANRSSEQEEQSQEVKVEDYFNDNVPEVKEYQHYISEKSENQADLAIRVYMDLETIRQDEEKKYYAVYVGEEWGDHSVNWEWFYVREDLEEILWYSMTDDIYLSLEEWRSSDYYREFE